MLWNKASDDMTPQEDIKYSIYYTSYSETCLENLDILAPQTGAPCNVLIPNFQEMTSGEWNSMVRGTNIKTTNGGTQLTVDVEGLTPTTKYYFTGVCKS